MTELTILYHVLLAWCWCHMRGGACLRELTLLLPVFGDWEPLGEETPGELLCGRERVEVRSTTGLLE